MAMLYTSCPSVEDVQVTYYVANRTNETIYFYDGRSESFTSYLYPDTSIQDSRALIKLVPNAEAPRGSGSNLDEIFNEYPADTLSFFFFEENVINNTDWEVVRENYLILKRYDLSAEDIITLNYMIPYPPTSIMEDMKQQPAFE